MTAEAGLAQEHEPESIGYGFRTGEVAAMPLPAQDPEPAMELPAVQRWVDTFAGFSSSPPTVIGSLVPEAPDPEIEADE